MGWELHEHIIAARTLGRRINCAARVHRNGDGVGHVEVTLYIGRPIVDEAGIQPGKIAVFWGTGADKGWIKLDRTGPERIMIRPAHSGKYASFSMSLGPGAAETHPREDCKWTILGDELRIKLPPWVTPPDLHALRRRPQ